MRVTVLDGSLRLYCNCPSTQTTVSLDSGGLTSRAAPSTFASELLLAGKEGEITYVDGEDRLQIHRVGPEDLRNATSWCQGEIVLNRMTLAQAVEEFNQQMSVAPEIGQLVVGGRFGNPDYRNFVAALIAQFPVEALPPNSAANPQPPSASSANLLGDAGVDPTRPLTYCFEGLVGIPNIKVSASRRQRPPETLFLPLYPIRPL